MGGVSRQEAKRLVDAALRSARRAAVDLGIVWRAGDIEDSGEADRREGPQQWQQASLWDLYLAP